MSIDALIDRFVDAMDAAGCPVAPATDVPWAELDRELGPLAFPADLRRLWERLDIGRLPIELHPAPITPEFALSGWRMLRDDQVEFPAGLFPWCYESHNHLLVELEGPGAAPGTMFEWAFAGSDFVLRFVDVGDWLETTSALLDEAAYERRTTPSGNPWLSPDVDRWDELANARLAERQPHRVYGTTTTFGERPEQWPEHWRAVAALAKQDPPVGARAMTVAAVLEARRRGVVTATVTGHVQRVGGRAGSGTRFLLYDDSGRLDVWCPADVRGHARLGYSPTSRVELLVEHWEAPRPPVDWWGVEPAELLAATPPEAMATMIHPPVG